MDKAVLITGAAGALGSAVVDTFLDKGIQVKAIISPDDDPDFRNHKNLNVYQGDLSSEMEAASVLEKALVESSNISMAIFTVGGFSMGTLNKTGIKDIRAMMELNFETAYNSARKLFDYFGDQRKGGRMVFIGAKPGLNPGMATETVSYGFSKSLIFSLADLINSAGKKENISAAVVVPSIIDTAANRKGMPDADFSKWVKPKHLAEVIHFLFTEAGTELRDPILKVYGDS